MDDVIKLVTDEDTVIDSVEVFIANLKQQVIDATKPSPEQQAAIDKVFDTVTTQKSRLATAIVVNTPVDPNAP